MTTSKMASRNAGVTALLGCLIFTLGGCRRSPQTQKPTAAQLQQAATAMQLKFPPGTRGVGFATETGGPDGAMWLKVEIPKSQLATFIRGTVLAATPLEAAGRTMLGSDRMGWWDPNAPQQLLSGQATLADSSVLNLGLDESHADHVVVYLFWHQT